MEHCREFIVDSICIVLKFVWCGPQGVRGACADAVRVWGLQSNTTM